MSEETNKQILQELKKMNDKLDEFTETKRTILSNENNCPYSRIYCH